MRLFSALACFLLASSLVLAVEDEIRTAPGRSSPNHGAAMKYGPLVSCTVAAPSSAPKDGKTAASGPILAMKGLVVRLGSSGQESVCFDPDLLRFAAGWTGGFLDLSRTTIGTYQGSGDGAAAIVGTLLFKTPSLPGWAGGDGLFSDPRPAKKGPLPRATGKYRGLYRNADRIIFSYEIGSRKVLESAEQVAPGVLIRHFVAAPSDEAASILIDETEPLENGWSLSSEKGTATAIGDLPSGAWKVAAITGYPGASIHPSGKGAPAWASLPASKDEVYFDVTLFSAASQEEAGRMLAESPSAPDLAALCHGGPAQWPEAITLSGAVSQESGAYVVDTLPLPEQNPWNAWMRISAFDFFPDGRAAVATLSGDIWLVSGIDAGLKSVTWRRYAEGLYEPLGVKIVGGEIYVLGRDQITRLHDLDKDGEADYYECFNGDRSLYPSYHAYAFGLETDSQGYFYYVVGGNQIGRERPWHGCLVRVSPDGATAEEYAHGFRAPNGLEIGPHDEIAVSDNQGHWIPSSKISLVKRGGFYGHVADPRNDPTAPAPPSFAAPLCWLPMSMDNSSGGGAWVPADTRWGPFGGRLIHTSYGSCSLFVVLEEAVAGVPQAAVVRMPVKFESGIMRARFHPLDGQLYLGGLKGWQTSAAKDGAFQRVRFTGQPVYLPTAFHVGKDKLTLTFPIPLERESAADPGRYALEQWNYLWSSTYGSPDLSLAHPGRKERDPVEITAAELSADAFSVTLTVPGLQPVMQMELRLQIKAADGAEVILDMANTIQRIPEK